MKDLTRLIFFQDGSINGSAHKRAQPVLWRTSPLMSSFSAHRTKVGRLPTDRRSAVGQPSVDSRVIRMKEGRKVADSSLMWIWGPMKATNTVQEGLAFCIWPSLLGFPPATTSLLCPLVVRLYQLGVNKGAGILNQLRRGLLLLLVADSRAIVVMILASTLCWWRTKTETPTKHWPGYPPAAGFRKMSHPQNTPRNTLLTSRSGRSHGNTWGRGQQ